MCVCANLYGAVARMQVRMITLFVFLELGPLGELELC